MERDLRPHFKDPLQPAITVRQLDILRLLGKGNSFRDKEIPQEFQGVASRELKEIYKTFGVTGETAAVVHALNIGLLKAEELVMKDFDWSLFNTLKERELAILEAFTHARGQSLTEEEFDALGKEIYQGPKSYISISIQKAYDSLGLRNKTEAVVYYYAWRDRQQEKGEAIVPVARKILKDREVEILELSARGLLPSVVARRLSIDHNTVINNRKSALEKLGAKDLSEAIARARELGILKS